MSFSPKSSGLILVAAATLLMMTACETGRTTKLHRQATAVSDETTTGRQDDAFVGNPEGQPPVPGSPTAAGPDGKQPYNDAQARVGEGAEEGIAPPPHTLVKDAFERQ